MTLYHVTSCKNATEIVRTGFHDPNAGRYCDAGVWLADMPLYGDAMFEGERAADDAEGQCAVVIELPYDIAAEYEDVEFKDEHPDHRVWHIPHAVVNNYIRTARVQPCP